MYGLTKLSTVGDSIAASESYDFVRLAIRDSVSLRRVLASQSQVGACWGGMNLASCDGGGGALVVDAIFGDVKVE